MFDAISPHLAAGEGPVALAGGKVLCCEGLAGKMHIFGPNGESVREFILGGGPGGAAIGPDGRAYICNNGGLNEKDIARFQKAMREGIIVEPPPEEDIAEGWIEALDLKTGAVERLYEAYDGVRLMAPNDIVFDTSGAFYFTDFGSLRRGTPQAGYLYRCLPDGSRMERVGEDLVRPNGVGLSPDGKTVYVSETSSGRIWSFPVTGEWTLGKKELFYEDSKLSLDSMAVQADGAVVVGCPHDHIILRVGVDGKVDHIPTPPHRPANICFGGEDLRTAYIAMLDGPLYRTQWDQPGLRLNFGD